ncbi:MAG TPA: hypothetical protein VLV15_11085, partial [Dongiaceae bacterium]|nr:hypothetical protein [Dongiaceae bacterium]
LPRTPVDPLIGAIVLLMGLWAWWPGSHDHVFMDLKRFAVRLVVFYAVTTVASRPLGSRWVWLAFPLACALIGAQALAFTIRGAGVLAAEVLRTDQVWGSHNGLFNTLLVALPVTAGLAMTAGDRRARAVWAVAGAMGVAGMACFAVQTEVMSRSITWTGRWTPFEIARTAVACFCLLTLARLALEVRSGRAREGPRWLGVTLTLSLFAIIQLIAPALYGPAIPLLTTSAGLVIGTVRADRRARRSGREIAPEWRKAA